MTTRTISLRGESARTLAAHRALIVEDQPDIADLLAQILQPLGFQTFVAHNGVDALDLARTIVPDVITLDLSLPVKDGHSVLHELASDVLTRQIPVVVVSAYTGQLRPTSQVTRVLQKPFDVGDLVDAVTIAVGAPR